MQGLREFGDMYTWVALDPDSRLAVSWHVGKRDYPDAQTFATDLASRIISRVQITTDQLGHYRTALFEAFGDQADYATIRKSSGLPIITPDGKIERPESVKGNRRASVFGNPDPERITTSSIESQNLLMRMSMRRYMRAMNGFSRKIENKRAALALHFCYYNFCRISPPIRVTPAMEAGITNRIWEIEEIVGLVKNNAFLP
jgi:IS1 family transposase